MEREIKCELRVIMAQKNVNNIELAKKANLHYSYISDLRRGRSIPGVYNALLISEQLGVPINKIWHFVDKKKPSE